METNEHNGESEAEVDALFDRAKEVERDALYSALGRLLDGWLPVPARPTPLGRPDDGPSWLAPGADRRDWHLTGRTPMSAAEADVVRVARLKMASDSGSSAAHNGGSAP